MRLESCICRVASGCVDCRSLIVHLPAQVWCFALATVGSLIRFGVADHELCMRGCLPVCVVHIMCTSIS